MQAFENLEIVCVMDPALDRDAMDVAKYAVERDPEMVRELPGKTAIRFVCGPLTVTEFTSVDAATSIDWKLINAVSFGLVEVKNYPSRGLSLRPMRQISDGRGGQRLTWGEDEIEKLRRLYSLAAIFEIGGVIYERALAEGNEWGGGVVSFTLPQSSRDALARIESQRAAQTRRAAQIQNSGGSAASGTTLSAPSSGAASGATAVPNAGT